MKKNNQIIIGKSLLININKLIHFDEYSKIGVLTDSNIAKHFLSALQNGIRKKIVQVIIHPGEKMKTINQTIEIWKQMMNAGFDRHSLLINLGGGVIGDMGGFAASTYMRGIDFIQLPTTLLAMVDASIGNKTAIDFNEAKNVIGTFATPIATVIDTDFLKTLPSRQLKAAFAEIIKHGIIASKKYFDFVTSKKPGEFSSEELLKIINGSIKIKKNIVDKDSKESGLRKSLNFGHTIGHAIESLSLETKNPLLHGEAIAIGMVAESKLAVMTKLLSSDDFSRIVYSIENVGLPTKVSNISVKDILEKIRIDKKNKSGTILWTLPEKIGNIVFNTTVPEKLIISCIRYILN